MPTPSWPPQCGHWLADWRPGAPPTIVLSGADVVGADAHSRCLPASLRATWQLQFGRLPDPTTNHLSPVSRWGTCSGLRIAQPELRERFPVYRTGSDIWVVSPQARIWHSDTRHPLLPRRAPRRSGGAHSGWRATSVPRPARDSRTAGAQPNCAAERLAKSRACMGLGNSADCRVL